MVFLFIFAIILILIITSKIRIEIKDLIFTSKKINQSHLNEDFNIKIKILGLMIFPIFWGNINKPKLEKLKNRKRFKNMNINITREKIKGISKEIDFDIKELFLNLNIGTDSIQLTTTIIPIISTIIALILERKKVKVKNQNYKIMPIYNSGNLIDLRLSGIFEIKMIHIINIIIMLLRKRRVDKNERTSNRRSYDYSYE